MSPVGAQRPPGAVPGAAAGLLVSYWPLARDFLGNANQPVLNIVGTYELQSNIVPHER